MCKYKKSLINKNRKGFTLVEVILVMGLAAIIMIGIFVVYNKVTTSQRVSGQVNTIIYLSSEIKNLYGPYNFYGNFSFQSKGKGSTVNTTKGLPSNIKEVYSYYPLSIVPEAINGNENTGFLINLFNVTSEDCVRIISSLPYSNFAGIRVNSDEIYINMIKHTNVSYDITKLVTSCSSSNSNTIYFDNK